MSQVNSTQLIGSYAYQSDQAGLKPDMFDLKNRRVGPTKLWAGLSSSPTLRPEILFKKNSGRLNFSLIPNPVWPEVVYIKCFIYLFLGGGGMVVRIIKFVYL